MRLKGRNAVVYGAGRGMGRAVALTFAGEGAHVFLAGGARDSLRWVAKEIHQLGGTADVTVVDPLDPEGVERQLGWIFSEHGSLDVSFNLTTYGAQVDPRLTGLTEDRFASASFTRVRSNFITATSAARRMAYEGHGVILAMVVAGVHLPRETFAGYAIGSAALAEMFRQLEQEVAPRGVQVACLQSRVAPESPMLDGMLEALARASAASGDALRIPREDGAGTGSSMPLTDFASAAVALASGRSLGWSRGEAASASC